MSARVSFVLFLDSTADCNLKWIKWKLKKIRDLPRNCFNQRQTVSITNAWKATPIKSRGFIYRSYSSIFKKDKALTIWLSKPQGYYRVGIYGAVTMTWTQKRHKDTSYSLKLKVSKNVLFISSWQEWQLASPASLRQAGRKVQMAPPSWEHQERERAEGLLVGVPVLRRKG